MTSTKLSQPTRIFWTASEFDALARAVLERFPQCHFDQARSLVDLNLSLSELLTCARAALPPARCRNLTNANPVKKGLLAAMARLRGEGPPVSADKTHYVQWTDDEWRLVVTTLDRLFPEARYRESATLDTLKLSHLNLAAASPELPTHRQRYFTAFGQVKSKLLAVYRDLAASAPPAQPSTPEPAAQPKHRVQHGSRVFWTDDEWLRVIAELSRRNPHFDIQRDPTLASLSIKAVKVAQQVLPPDRQRNNLHDTKALKHALLNVLRRHSAALHKPAPAAAAAPAPSPAPAEPQPSAPEPQPPAPANAWEAACRPLAALLAGELVSALVPELLARLPALLAAQAQPATAQPEPPPPAAPRSAYPFIPPQRPPKPGAEPPSPPAVAKPVAAPPKVVLPVVGVVGPLPAQQNILRAAFPNVRLLFVGSDHQVDPVGHLHSCDRVVGMIGFMKHSTDGALHKHFNKKGFEPRYTRVTGGVTALKRQIEVWLKSGVLYQSQARSHQDAMAG